MKFDFDLNLLPVLEALLQHESVSETALRLGITQSAVSHALRRLRIHLGDALLVRSGNKMLPTPRAQALQPYIMKSMSELRLQLGAAETFVPESSRRTFTVSTTDVGEVVVAPSIISAMRRLAPHCKIQFVCLSPSDATDGLEQGEVDLSIGPHRFDSDSLYQQILFEQELVSLVSRRRYGEVIQFDSIEAFAELPHVKINPFRRTEDVYEWAFAQAKCRRNFVCGIHSFLAAQYLVSDSDVIATVPNCLPMQVLNMHEVHSVPIPVKLPSMQIWQIWHRRFHLEPANQWLRKLIHSIFEPRHQ